MLGSASLPFPPPPRAKPYLTDKARSLYPSPLSIALFFVTFLVFLPGLGWQDLREPSILCKVHDKFAQ